MTALAPVLWRPAIVVSDEYRGAGAFNVTVYRKGSGRDN
jgi:hypothetical protein